MRPHGLKDQMATYPIWRMTHVQAFTVMIQDICCLLEKKEHQRTSAPSHRRAPLRSPQEIVYPAVRRVPRWRPSRLLKISQRQNLLKPEHAECGKPDKPEGNHTLSLHKNARDTHVMGDIRSTESKQVPLDVC
ncbi:Hypothetical predicted protein [Pelobates cultripes]|uniref:Uncharacterized protein n=1 Tax=Pelobates cultripes TaxID=61616 RepID=A0AAD1WCH8_PELCU|nr:Hypothetical predicted protein [Pelobates cultripes]